MEVEQTSNDRETVEEIKQYLIKLLNNKYGYCGVASGKDMEILNSGNGNIIIKIELK